MVSPSITLACPILGPEGTLIVVAVLLVAWALTGALAWWTGRGALRGFRLAAAPLLARREGFDDLSTGRVILRGRVVALDTLQAPETGRPCVYFSITVDRWDKTATMGGFSGQWLRTEDTEEAAPFKITDGTNAVLVEPDGGQFRLAHVEQGERWQDDDSQIRYWERVIQEGDEVLVLGQARERGGFEPSEAYRGHNYRTVVCAGDGNLTVSGPPGVQTLPILASAALRLVGVVPLLVVTYLVISLFNNLFI